MVLKTLMASPPALSLVLYNVALTTASAVLKRGLSIEILTEQRQALVTMET
jgi:hypothetical protein